MSDLSNASEVVGDPHLFIEGAFTFLVPLVNYAITALNLSSVVALLWCRLTAVFLWSKPFVI